MSVRKTFSAKLRQKVHPVFFVSIFFFYLIKKSISLFIFHIFFIIFIGFLKHSVLLWHDGVIIL
jgi:hypothetical protein